jgi:hypothetical protein
LLDGELAAVESEAVKLHVSLCRECRKELAELQRLRNLVSCLPEAAAPMRVRETVQAAQARQRRVSIPGKIQDSGQRLPGGLWAALASANRKNLTVATLAGAALLALLFYFPLRTPNLPQVANLQEVEAGALSPAVTSSQMEQPEVTAESAPTQQIPMAAAAPKLARTAPRLSARAKPVRSSQPPEALLASSRPIFEEKLPPVEMVVAPRREVVSAMKPMALTAGDIIMVGMGLPQEIAEARRDLRRAVERADALRVENQLSSLPSAAEMTRYEDNISPPEAGPETRRT